MKNTPSFIYTNCQTLSEAYTTDVNICGLIAFKLRKSHNVDVRSRASAHMLGMVGWNHATLSSSPCLPMRIYCLVHMQWRCGDIVWRYMNLTL